MEELDFSNILYSFGSNLLEVMEQESEDLNSNMDSTDTSPSHKKTRSGRKHGRRHKRNFLDQSGRSSKSTTTVHCICCSRKIVLVDLPGSSPHFHDDTVLKMCARCSRLFPAPSSWAESESVQAIKSSVENIPHFRVPAPLNSSQFLMESYYQKSPETDDMSVNLFHTDSSQSLRGDEWFDTKVKTPVNETNSDSWQYRSQSKACGSSSVASSSDHSSDDNLDSGDVPSFSDFVLEQFELEYNQYQESRLLEKSRDELITGIEELIKKSDDMESSEHSNKLKSNAKNTSSDNYKSQMEELRLLQEENERLKAENMLLQLDLH